ncbi:unnamed protein product [Anisakis simplex]|uniref:CCR4-NOT transcription complex subunit 9 n=1 Tax=Anisakis simplex TaxID=6269 RepID=A0A3P6Q1K0_ANISI|nr:unnamed protein product [Anisakis simplex]
MNGIINVFSKKRETVPDLPLWLWHSFGSMSALLQEVISIYPAIMPPTLTAAQSNRVCNALALMQCVAAHKETRTPFLQAHIPLFLYPFLHTTKTTRPFEYLRLTSLGVIGALVKTDEQVCSLPLYAFQCLHHFKSINFMQNNGKCLKRNFNQHFCVNH